VTASVIAAVGRGVARRPRLATVLMRLPRAVPSGPLRARLFRSLSWPLALRFGGEAEVPVAGGSRMAVRTDDLIGRVLAISGVWEPTVTAAFRRAVAPGDVCLDIGAHIGYYALLAGRLAGPTGHVYAFEPHPRTYRQLVRNLELNGLTNVTAVEQAVGPEEASAELYEGPGTNSGLATLSPDLAAKTTPAGRTLRVDVAPVTAAVRHEQLERVRVIKIDVEWHELEVLGSLTPVFELGRPLSVFVEWAARRSAPEAADDLRSLCDAHGFSMYRMKSGYSLERLFPDRIDEPVRVESVPGEQCDLLLTR
jgi:FkbM family methyltransferase